MSQDPWTADLLAATREVLRQRLLPVLAGEDRYQAAMAANAIQIALRSIADAGKAEAAEQTELARITARPADTPVPELRRLLAQALRAGTMDDLDAQSLFRPAIERRLAISSPEHRWR